MATKRSAANRLRDLCRIFPTVAVVGARQVGKTTLLRSEFPDAPLVTFDPVQDLGGARRDPDLFLSSLREPAILDEIQYAPELAAALKRRIDQDRRPGRFLLSGSQHWQVLRGLADSLAGRVAFLDLEGFSLAEAAGRTACWLHDWLRAPGQPPPGRLPAGRPLYEQLWRGFLPEACLMPEAGIGAFHAGYLRTYIERDARLAGGVEDWFEFARFVRLVGALSSQEMNYSQLGRELGLHPQTARRWLALLIGTCQWHETPAWSGNAVKRVSKRPKGYLADAGQMAAALGIADPLTLASHPALGAIFATAAMAELRKQINLLPTPASLHHWRAHDGHAEVDCLIAWNGRIFPIEFKASSNPGAEDSRGITAFRAAYPDQDIAPGLVLAPCARAYPLSAHDWAVPWDAAPVG